jgi:hypothetical protein
MSYINVSSPTSRAILQISTSSIASTSSGYVVPALQDITVSNANGIFNWTQLDSTSQYSVTTPATNQISGNIVVDEAVFFDDDVVDGIPGIFQLSNDKTLIYFRVYFNGTGVGARFLEGQGYLSNLAPTVSPTAPVWVTPIQVAVNGDLTSDVVA